MRSRIYSHPQAATTLRPVGTPPGLLGFALIVLLVGGPGPNFGLALLAVAVLVAGALLLWRPGETPVLLIGFAAGWLGAAIGIFHANWRGLELASNTSMLAASGSIETAVTMSLLGLLALAVGLRWGAGAPAVRSADSARALALSRPLESWAFLYAVAFVVSLVAGGMVYVVPGLTQLVLGFIQLKWAFFFMLAYAAMVQGGSRSPLLPAAFLLELGLGIGGFFSDFKTVFVITIAATLAAGVRLSVSRLIGLGVLLSVLLAFALVWSSVKMDYRKFVVGAGVATQGVSVDYITAMSKLTELVGGLDAEKLEQSANIFINRLSYVEYFSLVIEYVPAVLSHTDGAILLDAVVRPLMPRLLFPNKSIIDDTQRTNLYTGGAAGEYEATSVSIGYVGETYIDFGFYGMLPALLAMGLIYGWFYRRLINAKGISPLFGMAVATTAFWNVMMLDNSFTKVFGGVVIILLSGWIVMKVAVPKICPWLLQDVRRVR